MDENQVRFAWGGCGNLITHCLKSNTHYNLICNYYNSIHTQDTWTNQEWNIRSTLGPHEHEVDATINLAWNNSLDTSFHYIIKNIVINHLNGPLLKRVEDVIQINKRAEDSIRRRNYVLIDEILHSSDSLHRWCHTIDPSLLEDRIRFIYNIWRDKTKLFYEKNSLTVLGYFGDLGIDYSPNTLYNILYANPYIRQQQF